MSIRNGLFRIIIPTVNSSKYIEDILAYYTSHSIKATVFVDKKSVDNTREIAERYFDVVDMENGATFIENAIGFCSSRYMGEWILRIDDDELPSIKMIDFIERALANDLYPNVDIYGFARHQCLASYEGTLMAHTAHDAFVDHRQWRLYKSDRVLFRDTLHTPGFYVDFDRAHRAPDDACMIHLNWIVHSYAERRERLARYDAVQPGVGDRDRNYYCVEESGARARDLVPLCLPEFDETVRSLSAKARRRRHEDWNWSIDV